MTDYISLNVVLNVLPYADKLFAYVFNRILKLLKKALKES